MEEIPRGETSRYIAGILREFVKVDNPLTRIDLGDVEERLVEGVMPLDVAPDGCYSDPVRKQYYEKDPGLATSVARLQHTVMKPLYQMSDTLLALTRITGLSSNKRVA